jgi:hypothetical protein
VEREGVKGMGKKKIHWRYVNWRAVEKILQDHDGISDNLKHDLLLGVVELKKRSHDPVARKRTPPPEAAPQPRVR